MKTKRLDVVGSAAFLTVGLMLCVSWFLHNWTLFMVVAVVHICMYALTWLTAIVSDSGTPQ